MLPLGKLKEFWTQLSKLTRCVLVKSGCEYTLGQKLTNDPECVQSLYEHVSLAHFVEARDKELKKSDNKSIIKQEDADWPREYVKNNMPVRSEDDVVRKKLMKFADETAFDKDQPDISKKSVSTDFVLRMIEDFI